MTRRTGTRWRAAATAVLGTFAACGTAVAQGAAPAPRGAPLVETMHVVDGIPLKVRHAPGSLPRGRHLVALNDTAAYLEGRAPYRVVLLTVDENGRIEVVRRHRSADLPMAAADFRPLPDGLWSYAYLRVHPDRPLYDLRFIDPASGAEVVEPRGFPHSDPESDGHESVLYVGDRRIFLYYRKRQEGGRQYVDMVVEALSARDGKRVGRWTSQGKFPATMTGDYLHFNALYPLSGDRLLASARSTSALYVINLSEDRIETVIDAQGWKVIGDPLGGFARQHAAHFRPNGNLLLYDNRDGAEPGARSRAVEYAVDWSARTLTMVWQQRADPAMPFRYGWGSASVESDGSVLVGWGDYPRAKGFCATVRGDFPVFTRMTRDGEPLLELRAPCGWATYRVFVAPAGP